MHTSRREVLIGAGALAGTGLLGVLRAAQATAADPKEAANALAGVKVKVPPPQPAAYTLGGDGVAGPWGEVRFGRAGAQLLPILIRSADKLGVVSLAQEKPSVVLGAERVDAITLTSDGVAFGKGAKPEGWSTLLVTKLTKAVAADRQKTRALMQLRAAFVSALPVHLVATKSTTNPAVATLYGAAAKAMGTAACTTSSVVSTVERTVTDTVEQWKSAEQQYQQCFAHETSGASGLACSLAPAGAVRDACAATVCAAKGFVDVLVAVTEVTHTIAEEVVRNVVSCVVNPKGSYKNVWTTVDRTLPGLEKPGTSLPPPSGKDVEAARVVVRDLLGSFGTVTNCLLNGKWSFAGIPTPIPMGDGNLAIPYGIKVCIPAACARNFTIQGMTAEYFAVFNAAMVLLAAADPEFLNLMAAIGADATVPLSVGLVLGLLPPSAAAVVVVIVAMVLFVLIYGAAIVGQLSLAEAFGAFSDGEVCIVHPTIALAMIKALLLGCAPTELVPPIVID